MTFKTDDEMVAAWVRKNNRNPSKLIDQYENAQGETCYVLAMSDRKRPLKIVTVSDGMYTRYGLRTSFACDGIEAITGADGVPLGFKFYSPYGECSDEYAHALWRFSDPCQQKQMIDFDFGSLKNLHY